MEASIRLAIVGSVGLEGHPEAQRLIDLVIDRYQPTVVVSGGARGIDTMAEKTALRRGIAIDIRRPKRPTWTSSEGGFKERNLEIAERCDRLVRIVASWSKTYGSGWTRDRAKEMGKPTEEFVV